MVDLLLLNIDLCILLNLVDIISTELVLFKLLLLHLLILLVLSQVHLLSHRHIILLLVLILVLLVPVLLVLVLVVSRIVFVFLLLHLQRPVLHPVVIPTVCLTHKLVPQVLHDGIAALLDDLPPDCLEGVTVQLESLQSLVGTEQERD